MKQLASSVEKFQAKGSYSYDNQSDGGASQQLRLLNSRAKTTLNLQQEARRQQDDQLAQQHANFQNRKQSNDTVLLGGQSSSVPKYQKNVMLTSGSQS